MIVTATEFKTTFGKYLELIAKEDIFITRNEKTVVNFRKRFDINSVRYRHAQKNRLNRKIEPHIFAGNEYNNT